MRISDWSSDVCSSDLIREIILQRAGHALRRSVRNAKFLRDFLKADAQTPRGGELGEAQKIVGLGESHYTSMSEIDTLRSEERRVGKECVSTDRTGWERDTLNKKKYTTHRPRST